MHDNVEALKAKIKKLEEENKSLQEDAAFKPIFDKSPLGIFRTSVEGKFLKVNQTLCDILLYKNPSEMLAEVKDIASDVYVHKEDREKVLNLLKEAENYARYEIEFKRRNGEIFTGIISAKLVCKSDGTVKYIEGTAEDISQFKRVEIEQKKTYDLYKTLINTISDTIIISDISGKIEFVSPSIQELTFPLSAKEIIGTNILDWINPDHHQKAKENLRKIINNLPYNFEEYQMKRGDGDHFFAEIRTTVLKNENGSPYKLISLIQDVTKRKKTEEVLRQTQDLYRTIIELSPAGILISFQGKILFLNTALSNIFNTANQWDLVGRHLKDLVLPRHKKEIVKILSDIEKKKETKIFTQLQVVDTSGQTKDVQISASPIFYDGKNCTFLFVNDITERVRAEKELRREKQLMDTFWNHVPDAVTFKNQMGEYFKVNKEFLKWIGVKDDEGVLGKTDKNIFGPKHFNISSKEERNVIKKGDFIVNEYREEIWPRRVKKWVMLTKMPLYDIEQNIVGVFSMTRDITREMKNELEIREREKWFRYIFDQSPVGKIILNQKFKINRANKSTERILELESDNLINKSVFKLFDQPDEKLLREKLISIQGVEHKSFQVELKIKNSKEELISVIVQGVNLKDSGAYYGDFLIHLIDIHKRKLAEDLLLVRNTELNNFVYKVSHDLRAPLTSIRGLINLINLEKDPAVFDQYIQMISGRVERLDNFIRDVLSHSKNLNLDIKIEKVDLKEIINDCLSRVLFHSSTKINSIVNIKGKELYSDYQRVHEILRNLISNAYQYSKKNRKNAFVKVETKTTQKYTRIIVEDNGIGIKKKFQPRIFDMFYRANEKVEGSGLGLYIVKLSVENLNGEIKFKSEINKGTKFEITLPNHYPK